MPAIEVENVSKSYGSVHALDDISFKVKRNTIFGFLGPNGAGKSTTIGILLQFLKQDRGTVRIFDEDVTHNAALKSRLSIIPDADLPRISGLKLIRHTARYYGHQGQQLREQLNRIVNQVGIREFVGRNTKTLSKGQKTKIKIANALISDPELIIADEPTSGLDPMARTDFLRLVDRLVNEEDKTFFFSSHVIGEVEKIADELVILNRGKVVANGTLAQIGQLIPTPNAYQISGDGLSLSLLESLEGITDVEVISDERFVVQTSEPQNSPQFLMALLQHPDVLLHSFTRESMNLEKIFMHSVNGGATQ